MLGSSVWLLEYALWLVSLNYLNETSAVVRGISRSTATLASRPEKYWKALYSVTSFVTLTWANTEVSRLSVLVQMLSWVQGSEQLLLYFTLCRQLAVRSLQAVSKNSSV